MTSKTNTPQGDSVTITAAADTPDVTPAFPEGALVRPSDVARATGVDAKVVRAFLRMKYPRALEAHGTTWVLPTDIANACASHFATRKARATVVITEPTRDDI